MPRVECITFTCSSIKFYVVFNWIIQGFILKISLEKSTFGSDVLTYWKTRYIMVAMETFIDRFCITQCCKITNFKTSPIT